MLSGTSSHTFGDGRLQRGDRIGHQRQFAGSPPSPPRRRPCPRQWFRPEPPPPVRRRNARDPTPSSGRSVFGAGLPSGRGKPMPPGIGATSVRSAAVNTATTPGMARAAPTSMPADHCMRVMRAHQHGVQHAGRMRIGAVVALAGQQSHILAPAHRSALQCCHHLFSPGATIRSSGGSGVPLSTDCMLVKAWRAMSATRSMTLPAVCGVTTT